MREDFETIEEFGSRVEKRKTSPGDGAEPERGIKEIFGLWENRASRVRRGR